MMPHLVMSPLDFGRMQVQFGFASKFGMHRSEEQNEGKKMEADSMVTLESQPTKPEVIFNIGILSSVANVFGEAEGFALVQAFALVETITHFSGIVDSKLFGMTIKDDCANSIVETDMEGAILISIQLETTIVPIATAPSLVAATKGLGVDVRIEEIEVVVMEE
ncbi:unnamed protein product [Sphagnum balticum]